MAYKLFLDDLRTVEMIYPDEKEMDYVIVRTYEDFVQYIRKNGLPAFISFDNDLGEDTHGQLLPDGYAAAKWLVYESGLDLRKMKFRVHSANPVARVQIESLLNNYLKYLEQNGEIC